MSDREPKTLEAKERIIASALWAAAGDALGWITELANKGTVRARVGHEAVTQPDNWVRKIGGRAGVKVPLPAGTYSDDTQLRLAVCRAIRGNGTFDAEAFARIELTTWQGYLLGAGRGSKAAANNLSKRGVNWFSNFFEAGNSVYVNAGGNGAAMRVQPHAWLGLTGEKLVLSVLRDAVITHGHAHGFAGAVFHATAVQFALKGEIVDPRQCEPIIDAIHAIPSVIEQDRQLDAFWRSAWEDKSGVSLREAVDKLISEMRSDLKLVSEHFTEPTSSSYTDLVKSLQLNTDRYRGSGLKTAIAASALAWNYREEGTKAALATAANELGSDTDTIATMSGAILGAAYAEEMPWRLQDRDYIVDEARRVAEMANGEVTDTFGYPDLGEWQAPSNQSDCVGRIDTDLALAGLGRLKPKSEEYKTGDAIWQWMTLPFGQTVLAKRRHSPQNISPKLLPGPRRKSEVKTKTGETSQQPGKSQGEFPLEQSEGRAKADGGRQRSFSPTIDQMTEEVIRSDFDPMLIGEIFNWICEHRGSIEDAIAFSSIVAKARIARLRRRSR